ncbi:hypothetical protein C0991_005845, partial [Blastosporella zonata]
MVCAAIYCNSVSKDTEEHIEKALKDLQDGVFTAVSRAASAHHGIDTSTLWRRYTKKTKPRNKAHISQMLLTPAQEEALVNWIKYLGVTGHPVSKKTIRPKARLAPNVAV